MKQRLALQFGEDIPALDNLWRQEIKLPQNLSAPPLRADTHHPFFSYAFFTRMLYSCLVDADFLDTEHFMDGDRGRGGYDDIPTLLARLEKYIAPWQNPQNELNRLRCDILNTCLARKQKGFTR